MAEPGRRVRFERECEVVQIPAGTRVVVTAGTEAVVTQTLGGTYTLQLPASGILVRLPGDEADAIGEATSAKESGPAPSGDAPIEDQVWAQLRTCYDPEIPVDIVELGLVYDLRISPLETGNQRVDVKMTLTAPGCGMGGTIAADARDKILRISTVDEADVEVVWDPPWNPRMISPEGRRKLGIE